MKVALPTPILQPNKNACKNPKLMASHLWSEMELNYRDLPGYMAMWILSVTSINRKTECEVKQQKI